MSFSYDFAINPSHPWHVLWHSGAIVFSFLFFNSGVLASFISGRHSKCRFLFPVSTYPWLTSGTPPSTSKRCCLPHRICGIIKHFHRPYILLKFLPHKLFHYTFLSLHICTYVAESSENRHWQAVTQIYGAFVDILIVTYTSLQLMQRICLEFWC